MPTVQKGTVHDKRNKYSQHLEQTCPNSRGRLRFDLYQNLYAASVQSIALRSITLLGSTYLCGEAFSQIKINQDTEAVSAMNI